jgi:PAS domain S-box-containing protein
MSNFKADSHVSAGTMVEEKKFSLASIRDITARKRAEEALQASETRYRRLFEAAQDGILILNAETGQIDDVNPYMIDMLHYSHEEFLGKKLWEVSPFKDTIVNRAAFEELQDKGYIRYKDLPLETKEGKHIAVEFVSNVYKANGNKVIQCNIRNITERKNSEEELREAYEHAEWLALFPEENPNPVMRVSANGSVLYCNSASVKMQGWECKDDQRLPDPLLSLFGHAMTAGQEIQQDVELGEQFYSFAVVPIAEKGYANVYGRNITDRKRAEEALQISETRYRRLFESAKDGILILEADTGQVIDANPFMQDLLGYSCEEFVGKTLWDIGSFKDIAASKSSFDELQRKGYVRYEDLPIETSDGRHINVEFISNVYMVGSKRVIQCNIRDITARRRAEEEVKKVLLEKNEEIRTMTRQLWQTAKLATMGELSASIAHELNNPLATVSLRVESLLEKTPEDNSNHRELGIIEQEVERMSKLIANLLQFSRRGQQQISTVDICEEIEKTLELIHYHLRQNNIVIQREFVQDVPPVHVDRQHLRQLFLNLFTNASDAMPQGGTLTIRVIAPPESMQVIMEIADTGTGIPPEILPKVAEPFYSTKPEGEGTGLGLAICRRIVEEHSGTFELVSEGIPGKGTTARISLPVKDRTNSASLENQ